MIDMDKFNEVFNQPSKEDVLMMAAQELQDHIDEGKALPTAQSVLDEINAVVNRSMGVMA